MFQEAIVNLLGEIVKASDVPDEVKISRENRRASGQIGKKAAALQKAIQQIDGPIDTEAERRAIVAIVKLSSELSQLGVNVESLVPGLEAIHEKLRAQDETKG